MSKIAVVYWSGTGNTEAMARAVTDGAKAAGAEAELLRAAAFDASMLPGLDGVAFGCPAMGAEELEDAEGEKGCPVRLLRLGQRGLDEDLGRGMHGKRHRFGLRQCHMLRESRRRCPGGLQGPGGCPGLRYIC